MISWPQIWGNTTQIWTNETWSSTQYISYGNLYTNYSYTLTEEDIQDFANISFSSAVSTQDANGLLSCLYPIETPIKRRSAKMG